MFEIKVDEEELKELCLKVLNEHIEKIAKETVLWDTAALMHNVKMTWNTVQNNFFYDPRFPKAKIGGKWYFHAEKTRAFLDIWFEEQRLRKT